LKPLRKSRKSFIVSARLTVVPQIARISSGSSEVGARGAERWGAEEAGRVMWDGASEGGMSMASELGARGTRLEAEGVRAREEWISPRRFFGGVFGAAAGLLLGI
jgi:hypothetical protein